MSPIPSPLEIWLLIFPVKFVANLWEKIMMVFSGINVTHGCIEIVTKSINKPNGYYKKIKVHIGSA